jgi:thiamine biosynthesis lipoprotein
MIRAAVIVAWAAAAAAAGGGEPPTFAGPAMGTTYRVRLAADIAGLRPAAVHREVEDLLARIDGAASTWRDGSDASRFNRAAAGEWVAVADDLATIVALARRLQGRTDGAFDVTVAPLVRVWGGGPRPVAARPAAPTAAEIEEVASRVGMHLVELRAADGGRPAALRKSQPGVELDLSAIAPGYAVDAIGARLSALGSRNHLVELGGEVRAWGDGPDGRPWRVLLRGAEAAVPQAIELPAGMALATATLRPGRSPLDPRTGRPVVAAETRSVTVRAGSCAEADALATAAAVLGVEAARSRGIDVVSPAPSTPAVPPAATPAAPSGPPGRASGGRRGGGWCPPAGACRWPSPRRRCSGRRSSCPSRRRCCWRCR